MIDLTKLTPSELIRLAIQDKKTCIEQGILINMADWGTNIDKKNCSVCFAGAVMYQKEKYTVKIYSCRGFHAAFSANRQQYYALSNFRSGNIVDALLEMGYCTQQYDGVEYWMHFKEYERGEEEEFYTQMEQIAQYLESFKLTKL